MDALLIRSSEVLFGKMLYLLEVILASLNGTLDFFAVI